MTGWSAESRLPKLLNTIVTQYYVIGLILCLPYTHLALYQCNFLVITNLAQWLITFRHYGFGLWTQHALPLSVSIFIY